MQNYKIVSTCLCLQYLAVASKDQIHPNTATLRYNGYYYLLRHYVIEGRGVNNLQDGYLIIYVMVLTFITMSIGLLALSVSSAHYTHAVDDVYRQNAAYGAQACAAIVAEELTENPGLENVTDQLIFDDLNNSQGRVSCSATISDGVSGAKNVVVTASMYRFATDLHPIVYRMRAELQNSGSSGAPAYQVTDMVRL